MSIAASLARIARRKIETLRASTAASAASAASQGHADVAPHRFNGDALELAILELGVSRQITRSVVAKHFDVSTKYAGETIRRMKRTGLLIYDRTSTDPEPDKPVTFRGETAYRTADIYVRALEAEKAEAEAEVPAEIEEPELPAADEIAVGDSVRVEGIEGWWTVRAIEPAPADAEGRGSDVELEDPTSGASVWYDSADLITAAEYFAPGSRVRTCAADGSPKIVRRVERLLTAELTVIAVHEWDYNLPDAGEYSFPPTGLELALEPEPSPAQLEAERIGRDADSVAFASVRVLAEMLAGLTDLAVSGVRARDEVIDAAARKAAYKAATNVLARLEKLEWEAAMAVEALRVRAFTELEPERIEERVADGLRELAVNVASGRFDSAPARLRALGTFAGVARIG